MIKLFSTIKTKNQNQNETIDDTNNANNPDKNLAENLFIFCLEKINEYKNKYKKVKNSSIFHFMNGNVMKSQSFDNINMSQFDDINKTILFDITSKRKNYKNNEYKENKDYNDNTEKKNNNKIININSKNKEEKKEINLKDEINHDNNDNNMNTNNNKELTFFMIDQENNFEVPIVPEEVLSKLSEDVLILYSDITLFLKDEYNKIIKINQMEKENKNKNSINLNLNIQILDKIKVFSEESFNFLIQKYQKNDQILNIKKKLRLIINHIKEYKTNFNLDKYLKNKNNYTIDEEELDIVNHMPVNYQHFMKDNLYLNNYINKTQDINNNNVSSKNSSNSKKFSSVNDAIKEKEEQKQMKDEVYWSKSLKTITTNNLNGRFNNFYRQYDSNSLVDKITNPYIYQFFNYKKNKYELDKSLGKLSLP
jgi:hypothetical protein